HPHNAYQRHSAQMTVSQLHKQANHLEAPRSVGGPDVMRAQLAHLISEAENCPHLMLQVLPIDAGAPPATDSFTVLRFDHRPDIVYVDSTFTGQVIESATTVEDAKETYDRLRAAALHPTESIAVMRRIMEEFYR
ncbi:DUF5753 domain-containing protein, partial [Kitasatospora sp. NPDC053057]|uniref:DUF5753 domain-containing protein n=1 Tax=Kitasatospora sp. NPDC053057 TaxID=3364062 RepID=UPI0037C960D1